MARSARSKGLKDPAYLKWLHDQPCVVCRFSVVAVASDAATMEMGVTVRLMTQATPTEAAHVGERGLSQKCSDREALPICRDHHTERRDSAHKLQKKFWAHHGLDKDILIAEYNRRFEEERV